MNASVLQHSSTTFYRVGNDKRSCNTDSSLLAMDRQQADILLDKGGNGGRERASWLYIPQNIAL